MAQTQFSIAFSGLSSCGLVRRENEDVWAAAGGLFVLADGMGGHKAGEVAAQLAVNLLIENVEGISGSVREETVSQCREAVKRVNQRIHIEGSTHPEWEGMGTTLTALLFSGSIVTVIHVGDSRAYRLRDGKLKQLTVDHTVMNRMRGLADAIFFKHVLTQAVGTSLQIDPFIQTFPVHAADRYLLCSDGLINHLSDGEIQEKMVHAGDLATLTEELVDLTNQRGGTDNTTVVAIQVGR